jgi:hypothetical protein
VFRRYGLLFNTEGTAAPSGAQPAAVPAAAPAAGAVPAVAPPAGTAPVGSDGTVDPAWLSARLAREREQGRKAALGELGVTDTASAKKVLDDAAAAAEAKKTADQRLLETGGKVTTLEQENARLKEATASYATAQMATLTPEQQAAVRALAPDTDPAGQLKTITAFAPTWGKLAPAAAPPAAGAAPTVGAPPAVAAPPATGTAPPANAPPSTTVSPPDRKAEYLALKAKNPHAAALYLNEHSAAIYPKT